MNKASGFALADQRAQRHGSTGNVPLHFQSDITKFTSPNFKDYSDYGFE